MIPPTTTTVGQTSRTVGLEGARAALHLGAAIGAAAAWGALFGLAYGGAVAGPSHAAVVDPGSELKRGAAAPARLQPGSQVAALGASVASESLAMSSLTLQAMALGYVLAARETPTDGAVRPQG